MRHRPEFIATFVSRELIDGWTGANLQIYPFGLYAPLVLTPYQILNKYSAMHMRPATLEWTRQLVWAYPAYARIGLPNHHIVWIRWPCAQRRFEKGLVSVICAIPLKNYPGRLPVGKANSRPRASKLLATPRDLLR